MVPAAPAPTLAALAPLLCLPSCAGTVSLGSAGVGAHVVGSGVGVAVDRRGVRIAVGGGGGRRPGPAKRAPAPDAPGRAGPLMREPLAAGRLISRFRKRRGASRRHHGVDWAAPSGTAVYAAGSGTVTTLAGSSSYGNHVRVRHGGGAVTTHAHLSAFAPGLREVSRVGRGQRIGAVDSTGRSTSPHLHHELAIDGVRADPLGVAP